MYAGTTIGKHSGGLLGVHQRIDRIARRQLSNIISDNDKFPTTADILYFEGNNGPDAIKRKSPSVDEPWHFIDPKKPEDRTLIDIIRDHRINLASALKNENYERASFEAAWLAHAIVDGLTPAHHYPLAEKIEELFGMPHHQRSSVKGKGIIKGNGKRDTLSKNWQYWGSGGVFSSHAMFEFGVATAILGHTYNKSHLITEKDIKLLESNGYEEVFERILGEIVNLGMYQEFMRKGWTVRLTKDVRRHLIPLIVRAVCLSWYSAIQEAK